MSNFSKWAKWKNFMELNSIKFSGIYVICYSSLDLQGEPFVWTEEVVYIGMTNKQTLKKRLKQFDETIKGLRNSHGGADRMRYQYRMYEEMIEFLFVSVLPVEYDNKNISPESLIGMGEVARLEFFYFAEFMSRFKNFPIFNRADSKKFSKINTTPPALAPASRASKYNR